jgi:diacylglycerol O-acyltransferase
VAGALADHAREPRPACRGWCAHAGSRRGTDAVKPHRALATVSVPDFSGEAPWCVLNDAFTPGRAYARAALPLAGLKHIKDAAGVTLNDTVLAVDGRCLPSLPGQEHGGIPGPAAAHQRARRPFEPPDAPVRQAGNRFWSFTTSLATDVDDPWRAAPGDQRRHP